MPDSGDDDGDDPDRAEPPDDEDTGSRDAQRSDPGSAETGSEGNADSEVAPDSARGPDPDQSHGPGADGDRGPGARRGNSRDDPAGRGRDAGRRTPDDSSGGGGRERAGDQGPGRRSGRGTDGETSQAGDPDRATGRSPDADRDPRRSRGERSDTARTPRGSGDDVPRSDRDQSEGDRPEGPRPGGATPEGPAERKTRNVPSDRDQRPERSLGASAVTFLKEVLSTVAAVAFVGLLLFAISGVWPPLVAVESGSMEPHMFKGDLVFIVEDGRFAPQEAVDGVVTMRTGEDTGYWSFGNHGNVVVYRPHRAIGSGEFRDTGGTPIIHRARFHVEEGEDWVAMADERFLGRVDSCEEVSTCPAPHDGFITKGDRNSRYDQVAGRSAVVKSEWIRGVAKVRIPWLGCVRLQLSGDSCF